MDNSRSMRRRANSGGTRLPLPAYYFPPVDCNESQAVVLRQEADKLVRDTVRSERWELHNEDRLRGWKLWSSKKDFRATGTRVYYCKPDTVTESTSPRVDFKCMGRVALPLDHIMDAFYADNTSDFRRNTGTLVHACLDAAVLHVIRSRSDQHRHRYLGINWIALRGDGLFAKKRDVCYLKSTGTTFDADNNEVGFLVMRSIDIKACPSMEHSHGLVRVNISAVLLLRECLDGRSTDVIWKGTLPLSKSSSSKLLDMVHAGFMSCVSNLNVINVTRFLNKEYDLERYIQGGRESKSCRLCSKKFSLLRSRHVCHSCGEMMCRDCEVTRQTTSLDRESMMIHPSFGEKDNVRRYCKECIVSARRKAEKMYSKPTTYDFTASNISVIDNSAINSPATFAEHETYDDRLSAISSSGSQSSIQLTWPDLAKSQKKPGRGYSASVSSRLSCTSSTTSTPTYANNSKFSHTGSSQVPVSPLTVKTAQMKMRSGRERVETDHWEYYDAFEQTKGAVDYDAETGKPSLGGRGSLYEADTGKSSLGGRGSLYDVDTVKPPVAGRGSLYDEPTGKPSFNGRGSTYSHDGLDDLATRLMEISRIAQETLDVTRRNSCLMSDTASAPRSSEQFLNLNESIAEQADLLNVIGLVSTGRVYMETDEDENGDTLGVRVSESSIDESERFEILA